MTGMVVLMKMPCFVFDSVRSCDVSVGQVAFDAPFFLSGPVSLDVLCLSFSLDR